MDWYLDALIEESPGRLRELRRPILDVAPVTTRFFAALSSPASMV
jgi:hypothetical protein